MATPRENRKLLIHTLRDPTSPAMAFKWDIRSCNCALRTAQNLGIGGGYAAVQDLLGLSDEHMNLFGAHYYKDQRSVTPEMVADALEQAPYTI
jgi:hypothetical protein